MLNIRIRLAVKTDLDAIIVLLHDDALGQTREATSADETTSYRAAFDQILAGADYAIFVMEEGEEVIGCYQLMLLPHISFLGATRAQIESVRVTSARRGQGLGKMLIRHAIDVAKDAGCGLFQLTSNKARTEAGRFYRELGLEATHDGYKLYF